MHFFLALASAALWVGGGADSPPISYLVFLSGLASAHWFYFSFISFSPTPWIFGFSGFSDVSDMEILEDSALEGSFLCLLPCKLLGLLRPISLGVFALVTGFLIFFRSSVGVLSGSCSSLSLLWWKGIWRSPNRTALLLQKHSLEVFSLPSCFVVSWWRRT